MVARLLNELLIEQTKSRPRHFNDNGLAEAKNGAVVRKHMAYTHVPAPHAKSIGDFCEEHLNPGRPPHLPPGEIPGTNKPTLLKPGAEKLCNLFGLEPEFKPIVEDLDWMGAEHGGEVFCYARYRCRLLREGRVVCVGEGSCNSWEAKYRYRWVAEELVPEVQEYALGSTKAGLARAIRGMRDLRGEMQAEVA